MEGWVSGTGSGLLIKKYLHVQTARMNDPGCFFLCAGRSLRPPAKKVLCFQTTSALALTQKQKAGSS